MGIRETLNQNPGITTGATAAVIVIALIFIIWQLFSSGRPSIQTTAWYTVDDGATWFEDDINKVPPFDHDGKPAYRVHVYTCDGGKTKFVSHLERFTPEAKAKIEQARDNPEEAMMVDEAYMTGMEVKDPGSNQWVKQTDYARSTPITEVQCPEGGGKIEDIEPVLP